MYVSRGCAEAMTARATHGSNAPSSRARALHDMCLNENLRGGGGIWSTFSSLSWHLPGASAGAKDCTTRVEEHRLDFRSDSRKSVSCLLNDPRPLSGDFESSLRVLANPVRSGVSEARRVSRLHSRSYPAREPAVPRATVDDRLRCDAGSTSAPGVAQEIGNRFVVHVGAGRVVQGCVPVAVADIRICPRCE